VDHKEYARQSALIPYNESNQPATNSQGYQGFGMYTLGGTGFMGDDLSVLFNRISNNSASTVWDDYKIKFTSCVMDVFMQARITNTNTIRFEINYFVCTRDIPLSAGTGFRNLWEKAIQETPIQQNSTFTAVGINTPGVEIFDISKMGRYLKVYKKQEVILSPGQTTTWQMRDARNHWFQGTDVQRLLMKKGSRGFFYTVASFWNGTEQSSLSIDTRIEKHYSYVIKSVSVAALGRTS